MDLKSLLCLVLPTLATLHLSGAEDPSLADDGSKTSLEAGMEDPLPSFTAENNKRWSNFNSWGKRWGHLGSLDKGSPTLEFPEKKWGNSAFRAWGKRGDTEEQKRHWNQFLTWGKRNWHSMKTWGKRAQPDKKWNSLSTWGKRAGWDSGFAAWGKRGGVDVTDKLMKLFDANDDGVLDGKEVGNFLTWLGSMSREMPAHQ